MYRWVLALVVASCCFLAALTHGQGSDCAGPVSAIRVTAQQLSKSPARFAFLVTNLTDSPILTIVIGKGTEHSFSTSILGAPYNRPTSMTSPEQWSGELVQAEERPFVTYMWHTKKPGAKILPGQSLSGFSITLAAVPPGLRKQYFEGTEVVQTNFKGLPFHVGTADGRCYWGLVGADLLEH
jgi:hypothetical protein